MLVESLIKNTVELQEFRVMSVVMGEGGLLATLGPDGRYLPRCGCCGEPAAYRDARPERRCRHVPLWGMAVTLAYSDPTQVVNPDHRHLDGQVRSRTGRLNRRLARFGAMNLEETIEPEQVEPFLEKKAALHEEIESLRREIQTLKETRKATARHIRVDELPEAQRFRQLQHPEQTAHRHHQDDRLPGRDGHGQ